MGKHPDKTTKNKSIASVNQAPAQLKSNPGMQFADTRSSAVAQLAAKDSIDNSQQVQQLKAYQTMADNFTGDVVQRKQNRTGLPDNLKSGVENLSGFNLDDVKVHYNSPKPPQLNAHAYAQGTDIHVAPGQEKHLPHEAWHVVQQKQGRVTPTRQLKGKQSINDDKGLEHEADLMGAKAVQLSAAKKKGGEVFQLKDTDKLGNTIQRKELATDKLNVVGENHTESGKHRPEETKVCHGLVGGGYWAEDEFLNGTIKADRASLRFLYGIRAFLDLLKTILIDEADTRKQILRAKTCKNEYSEMITVLKSNYNEEEELLKGEITETPEAPKTALTYQHNMLRLLELYINKLSAYPLTQSEQVYTTIQAEEAQELYHKKILASILKMEERLNPKLGYYNAIRSREMHNAAQKKAETLGVWKIGDSHVEDIKNSKIGPSESPRYNLLTKAEFDIIMAEARQKEHDSSFFIHLGLPM